MRFVSLRRAVPACAAAAAALAFGVPGVASATTPKPDVLEQCSGAQLIESEGSTFAAPAEFYWTGENTEKATEKETHTGFNFPYSTPYKYACSGTQGSHQTPKVVYNQEEEFDRGSGSCLKTWGNGVHEFNEEKEGSKGAKEKYPRVNRYPLCGTDEAPSKTVKEEFEKEIFTDHATGSEFGNGEAIESLPVAQGAVAVIVHLPNNCLAKSEPTNPKDKVEHLGRLVLERAVIEGIYKGSIKTWKEVLTDQASGKDELACTGGSEDIKYIEGGVEKELTGKEKATSLEEEEEIIRPVVREDKSGTTHIFKSFLEQVNASESIPMEEFRKVYKETPCPESEKLKAGEPEKWETVTEGCENQRWPEAAHVLRPEESGNPGVVNKVNNTPSSVGYADLAVAQELKFFTPPYGGEEKAKEQHREFWAPVQDSENSTPGETVTYTNPSSQFDKEKEGNSNCKDTTYIGKVGSTEKIPPETTREDWSKVKAEDYSETYPICGLTYVLAARQYWYFLEPYGVSEEESQKIATTVHNYLQWVVEGGGGGKVLANHDYEKLTSILDKKALLGAEEIGSKKA